MSEPTAETGGSDLPRSEPAVASRSPWARLGSLSAAWLRIVDSGIPDTERARDPEFLRRARIVLSFTLVLILLGLEAALFFVWVLPPGGGLRVELALLAALLLAAGIPHALRRHSLALAANLLLAASWLVIFTAFTVSGGIHAPILHWCGLLTLLAALMGAHRSTWIWAAVGLASIGFLVAADARGWHVTHDLGLAEIEGAVLYAQRFTDVGSWIAMFLAIGILYDVHSRQQTLRLASKNAELESEIEQRSRAEKRSRYLAYYDELTTLPNRRLFAQQLIQAMTGAARSDKMVGVLFLDLDGFKKINDTLGHALGDELLQHVAERLRTCVRMADSISRIVPEESGVVSRLGGDEFTILLTDIRDHREAALVAKRILRCLEQSFFLDRHEVFISGSIGIALYPGSAQNHEDLLRNADLAMYHAKEHGKNHFKFYEESMNADIVERTRLTNAIRRALDRGEFELHYQPIVSATSQQIVGVEALTRWIDPERGTVPACDFIEVAEESGLIVRLGDWAIREACRQFQKWRAEGTAPERLAVNVSAVQLRRGAIVGTVRDALREFDLDPRRLELEVTESAVMVDEEDANRCICELKRMGVTVSLDDFGTGYSSLSYVKRFPVDSLKIDRSFVADIGHDPEAQAVALAIIAMGRRLDMKVIGEGVETEAQQRFLADQGCNELQGFRFGRPVSADTVARLISEQKRASGSGSEET